MSSIRVRTLYVVEVITKVPGVGEVISTTDRCDDVRKALTLAQDRAVQMFKEDPMAWRTFCTGHYEYFNTNDLGDRVHIRVRAEGISAGIEDCDACT